MHTRYTLPSDCVNDLCRWDERNPDNLNGHRDEDDPVAPCGMCDACFYGKHALADALWNSLRANVVLIEQMSLYKAVRQELQKRTL